MADQRTPQKTDRDSCNRRSLITFYHSEISKTADQLLSDLKSQLDHFSKPIRRWESLKIEDHSPVPITKFVARIIRPLNLSKQQSGPCRTTLANLLPRINSLNSLNSECFKKPNNGQDVVLGKRGPSTPVSSASAGSKRQCLDPEHKPCNCRKSKCLKLYCECFARGVDCGAACSCVCCNNLPHLDSIKQKAKQSILHRNPSAFRSRGSSENSTTSVPHGCNCRKSNCQKKYCECFQ